MEGTPGGHRPTYHSCWAIANAWAGQPWLWLAGSWKAPGTEILPFQAARFRTALGAEQIFSRVQPGIWVGWTLWQAHLPPADALLLRGYHQADTLLFRRGMLQMGCVDGFSSAAELQSYLQIAATFRAATSSAGLYSIFWLRIQRQQRYSPNIPPFRNGLLNPINHNYFLIAQPWNYWQTVIVEKFAKRIKDNIYNCMNETCVSHGDPWAKVQFM